MDENRPMNRRRFFREGLRELLRPLANAVEPLERAAKQIGAMEDHTFAGHYVAPEPEVRWLRPPGALPERRFLDTCSRCGDCVRVCPAQCIRIDVTNEKGGGAPYIDVDTMPCVVCDGLLCMSTCPTGALLPTALQDITMGLAVWNEHLCVRTHGENCTICVDKCPVGASAIRLTDGRIEVLNPGCIGCGVCQAECPTSPKSVVVEPRSPLAYGD
jgi:ferredoxin-type protein NapG